VEGYHTNLWFLFWRKHEGRSCSQTEDASIELRKKKEEKGRETDRANKRRKKNSSLVIFEGSIISDILLSAETTESITPNIKQWYNPKRAIVCVYS